MKDNIYRQLRRSNGLSREAASALSEELISPERLERIENGKMGIHPDEVLLLSDIYKEPSLCNHYCSTECPIGKQYVPEIKPKELSGIILEMLSSLNTMKNKQERLIEITADGAIDDGELEDFIEIQQKLENISITVESLQLWLEKMIDDKKINIDKYNKLKTK